MTSIIHVITTIEAGGAEKQLLNLAASQKSSGDSVQVWYLKGSPTLLEDFRNASVVVSTRFAKLNFLQQLFQFKKQSSGNNSVFHAHLPRSELICALVLRPKTFVVTRHNAEAFFPKAPRFLSILLSRFVLKRAFACISISNAVASFLKSAKEIPDGSDSLVIYYGTANQSVSKSHKPTLDAHSLFRIGTVARLTTQKNIPLLLNAIGELQNYNVREFNLSIAGTGPLEKDLKRMAQQLGISQNVKWVGKIKEIEAFYRNLDLFVLTSDYEGFGLVLLEAMSQGIPIIARRVSAIPEVLGIGHPGLIDSDNPIELATKIRSFLTQPHTMERCVQYQYLKIKDFSIDRTRKSHGLVYKSLLESQDRRSL